MSTLPATEVLKALADDPTLTPERRADARGLLAFVEASCEVATRWGYDRSAGLRMGIFKRAVLDGPGEFADERIALGLALDELCDAAGVPLEGSPETEDAPC